MARIPLGNFGNAIAQPAPAVRVTSAAFDKGGSGAQKLGDDVLRVADSMASEQRREDDALQKVKLAGQFQDRQIQYDSLLADLGRRSEAGELEGDKIHEAFKSATSLLPKIEFTGMPPDLAEKTRQSVAMLDHKARLQLDGFVAKSVKSGARSSVDHLLDGVDKQMADPNADPDKVTAFMNQADFQSAARLAYGDATESKLQGKRDQAWFTAGKNSLIAAGGSAEGLRGFLAELEDPQGRFAGRLDGDKSNALKMAARSQLDQVLRREQHEMDKRLADAERAVQEYSHQITTTTKARPEDYLNWSERVRGTPSEGQLAELQTIEGEVQKVVAMPPEQQDKFLSDARAAQRIHGAGEKQIKMLNALEEAVGKNRKMMAEEPLRYLTERTGQAFQSLTPVMLQQGDDGVANELQTRLSSLVGLRKSTGGRTELKLLSKDEADQIGKALTDATPSVQGSMLGMLRNAVGDQRAYADTVRQLAKDDPVLAYAGIAQGRSLTTTNGRALSDLLLEGRAIVRDGSFKMPTEKAGSTSMQKEFSDYVGGAIEPGASSAREDTFKAASAVYAKLAKDAGKTDGTLDSGLYKQAVRLVTGGVIEHAGYKTIPPYGISEDVFNDRALTAKAAAEKANDAPEGAFSAMQLRAVGPNRYELLNGQRRQVGKDGASIILTIE